MLEVHVFFKLCRWCNCNGGNCFCEWRRIFWKEEVVEPLWDSSDQKECSVWHSVVSADLLHRSVFCPPPPFHQRLKRETEALKAITSPQMLLLECPHPPSPPPCHKHAQYENLRRLDVCLCRWYDCHPHAARQALPVSFLNDAAAVGQLRVLHAALPRAGPRVSGQQSRCRWKTKRKPIPEKEKSDFFQPETSCFTLTSLLLVHV